MIIKDAYRDFNEGRLNDWCLHLEIYHKAILMLKNNNKYKNKTKVTPLVLIIY